MTQREGHIALRQCDSLSIVERAQDLQCAAMALDGVVIQAVATVLRPGGVELKRLAMRVGLRDTGREPYARRERRLHQPMSRARAGFGGAMRDDCGGTTNRCRGDRARPGCATDPAFAV